MKVPFTLLTVLLTLVGYAQAAISREVRSLLEEALQMESLVLRSAKTSTSHVDKSKGEKVNHHYTNVPRHKYCFNRSAVVAGDDDIENTPNKSGPPKAGERELF